MYLPVLDSDIMRDTLSKKVCWLYIIDQQVLIIEMNGRKLFNDKIILNVYSKLLGFIGK